MQRCTINTRLAIGQIPVGLTSLHFPYENSAVFTTTSISKLAKGSMNNYSAKFPSREVIAFFELFCDLKQWIWMSELKQEVFFIQVGQRAPLQSTDIGISCWLQLLPICLACLRMLIVTSFSCSAQGSCLFPFPMSKHVDIRLLRFHYGHPRRNHSLLLLVDIDGTVAQCFTQ